MIRCKHKGPSIRFSHVDSSSVLVESLGRGQKNVGGEIVLMVSLVVEAIVIQE